MSDSDTSNIPGWENPYTAPGKFGVELVAELDMGGSYEFDMVIVLREVASGDVYAAHDTGCSCPTPFEDHKWPSDYTQIRSIDELDPLIGRVYNPPWAEVLAFKSEARAAFQ